eukprot:XP_001695260.1 flagellar associated protein [Chlamydomonas reinhardtii]
MRRQQQHLEMMSSLNREVEGYRAEAAAAGQALHHAGMHAQFSAESAMRRQDTAALDGNMRAMEGALLAAQEQVARRVALQSRLDAGLGQVAAAVDAARAGVEDREAALRAQINGALGKVRAYARDMEEGLEQERLRLEEVVKLEIRARQQSGDALKEALEAGVAKVAGRVDALEGQHSRAASKADELARALEEWRGEAAAQAEAARAEARRLAEDLTARVVRDTDSRLQAALAPVRAASAAATEELAAARGQLAGQGAELAALRGELEAVGGLVAVHGEVFVDVRRKLSSLEQRAKTGEANLANAVEELGERLEAAGSRCGLARQQSVLEEVMAQAAEEAAGHVNELTARCDELARMLEDEDTNAALTTASAASAAALAALATELASRTRAADEAAAALGEELRGALGELDGRLESGLEVLEAAFVALGGELRRPRLKGDTAPVTAAADPPSKVAALEAAVAALREEQSRALDEQGQAVEAQAAALEAQAKGLEEQAAALDEAARQLEEQGRVLEEQGRALDSCEKALQESGGNAEAAVREATEMRAALEALGKRVDEIKEQPAGLSKEEVEAEVGTALEQLQADVGKQLGELRAALKKAEEAAAAREKEREARDRERDQDQDQDKRARVDEAALAARLAEERSETGRQLDELRAQVGREADAKLAAAQEAAGKFAKEAAVADLERKMHAALDESLERIRGEVAADVVPLEKDVGRIKAALHRHQPDWLPPGWCAPACLGACLVGVRLYEARAARSIAAGLGAAALDASLYTAEPSFAVAGFLSFVARGIPSPSNAVLREAGLQCSRRSTALTVSGPGRSSSSALHAALVQLLTFRRNEQFKLRTGTHAGAGAADVAGTRTPVAFVAPSSGTRRAVAGGSQQQQLMLVPGQRSAFSQLGIAGPVLAVSAAAAALYAGSIMWQRWRAGVERKREVKQYAAMQEPALARQKQRFQRALVVDSVNLELPAIKEMDIQPGPVQVEKIISRQPGGKAQQVASAASSSSGTKAPTMDTASLRQWQQFMACSRTTEVQDELRGGAQAGRAGSSGRAAANLAANLAPHGALGDAALKDLSERIRRAGEGAAKEEAPIVTFEQLYANSRESDEEAMARRAAERKARWQQQQQTAQEKQQPGGSGPAVGRGVAGAPGRLGGAVSRPGLTGTGNATSAAPPTKREPLPVAAKDELSASLAARSLASNSKVAARPEPQAGPRSKAFASGPAPATTPAAAPGAAGSSDTSFGAARPVNSRLEVSLGRSARPSPSSPLMQGTTEAAQPTSGVARSAPPAPVVAVKAQVGVLALALAGLAKEQLVTSLGSGSNNSSRDEDDGAEGGSRRGRRVAAGGPLRTPDTQAPGLTRLMRRPTGSPPVSPAAKQDTAVLKALLGAGHDRVVDMGHPVLQF